MITLNDDRIEAMGELNNQLIALIDSCQLTPPEVVLVLRLLITSIERTFQRLVDGE